MPAQSVTASRGTVTVMALRPVSAGPRGQPACSGAASGNLFI